MSLSCKRCGDVLPYTIAEICDACFFELFPWSRAAATDADGDSAEVRRIACGALWKSASDMSSGQSRLQGNAAVGFTLKPEKKRIRKQAEGGNK
jgi:hypothetical protein